MTPAERAAIAMRQLREHIARSAGQHRRKVLRDFERARRRLLLP